MTESVSLLVSGMPAELVREIGLRLRGVVISEFENTQQMGRAAARGEARLVLLSDALPPADSIYIASRATDANDDVRIAFSISMQQAEAALRALKAIHVDRFFLSPVDTEEMLWELAKMGGVEVLPPQASHGEHIAAAVSEAWDRAPSSGSATAGPFVARQPRPFDAYRLRSDIRRFVPRRPQDSRHRRRADDIPGTDHSPRKARNDRDRGERSASILDRARRDEAESDSTRSRDAEDQRDRAVSCSEKRSPLERAPRDFFDGTHGSGECAAGVCGG